MPNLKRQRNIQQHCQSRPTKGNILSQPVATALIRAVSGRRSIACFVLGVRLLLPHFSHSKQHNRNMHGPVTHAKPQKAKKHTVALSSSTDKGKHPQPARRNCSHQGSQWKEKYCLFRPWCPLVAATFLTQQATQKQHARTTSQAAGSPSAAQFPCDTCQTAKSKEAYSSIVSSSQQRETSSASPSQLLSSGQSVEGEVLLVSSLVSACCCHISHTASNTTATCMVHITSGW